MCKSYKALPHSVLLLFTIINPLLFVAAITTIVQVVYVFLPVSNMAVTSAVPLEDMLLVAETCYAENGNEVTCCVTRD